VKNGNSSTADKFVLRLPDGLRSKLADQARDNSRSMNAEMVSRLLDSLNRQPLVEINQAVEDRRRWVPSEGVLVTVNGFKGVLDKIVVHDETQKVQAIVRFESSTDWFDITDLRPLAMTF
jgi:hypothetical protein